MPRDTHELPCPSPLNGSKPADVRAEFARLTKQTPRDAPAERAFMLSKFHMLRTHPRLKPREREEMLAELATHFKKKIAAGSSPPVPGGVGYGMFYYDPFRNDFATGTGIYCDIICPQPPGGNISTYFYLTATNRAARGVEAFISYDGQSQTFFKVFDWARPDHWQISVPFAGLSSYLKNSSAHGNSYQVLPVLNVTIQRAVNAWYNQVWLWNNATGGWDLIYEYSYAATLVEQQTGFVGTWGPIVETFQPSYLGTNPMGALMTQFLSRNTQDQWGAWHLLTTADSYVRTDNKGFNLLFLDPNYSWAVSS